MYKTLSLHKIDDKDYLGFEPSEYSRFKYGDDEIANKFGVTLGNYFIEKILGNGLIKNQIVVFSSPYAFIPTATFAMKNYFIFTINRWLAENNYDSVQESKINRTITYKEDYGELDASERIKLIGNDTFHLDEKFMENKTLLFLDDIKITGSHERMILRTINDFNLKNDFYLIYFAELINPNIHPNIENYLNYFSVKSIFDLKDIINSKNFKINTRIVKYILFANSNSFNIFIEAQTNDFKNLLYNMAIGNNYHKIEEYQQNLEYLASNYIINNNIKIYNGN